jgi:SpoVK/Ycf46/Vps4 family AAA+-type ATPase
MDGFTPHEDIVVLAATNRPDVLDKALLRPGRFDRKVYLELPGRAARQEILEIHVRDIRLADDVDLERLAARTVGFSGADLENLVNEAALLAGRRRRKAVDMQLFADARDKLVLGAEREQAIGPVVFKRGDEYIFLGREMAQAPEFSDDTARREKGASASGGELSWICRRVRRTGSRRADQSGGSSCAGDTSTLRPGSQVPVSTTIQRMTHRDSSSRKLRQRPISLSMPSSR